MCVWGSFWNLRCRKWVCNKQLHHLYSSSYKPMLKIKLTVPLIEHYAMKFYGRVARRILNIWIRWRWAVRFTHRPLNPLRKRRLYYLLAGSVNHRAGVEVVVVRDIFLCLESNSDSTSRSQSLLQPNYPISSLYIFRSISSRKMRWLWHIAQVGQTINAHKILIENPKWRD